MQADRINDAFNLLYLVGQSGEDCIIQMSDFLTASSVKIAIYEELNYHASE